MREPTTRMQPIDALRGIAVLAVALFHFTVHYPARVEGGPHPARAAFEWVAHRGLTGVDVFFVVSGFVIAYSVRDLGPRPRDALRFVARRSLRLDPPYWAALALVLASGLVSRQLLPDSAARMPQTALDLPVNLLYLQGFLGVRPLLPVAWTLCIEIQFYLVFIAMHCLFGRCDFRWRALVLVPLAAWSLLTRAEVLPQPLPGLFLPYWYPFQLGALVAWSHLGRVGPNTPRLAIIAGASFLTVDPSATAVVGLVTAGAILAAAQRGLLHSAVPCGPLLYAGSRSYSIYLIHTTVGSRVMNVMERWTHHSTPFVTTLAFIALAFAVTLMAAEVFYRVVERPSIALAKRLAAKRRIPGPALLQSPP